MSRIVSVWFKAWPISRLLRAQASASPLAGYSSGLDANRALVLVASGKGGQRIVCLNRAARDGGLSLGELLSSARAKVVDLQVYAADPVADAAALRNLALWAMQYSPIVAVWDEASGADGLFLDVTGAAHLFGGEERLLADLEHRLRSFALYPRLAVAGTAGAAWALARHGKRHRLINPSGAEREAIENLPLAALRLPDETLAVLRRLGFRRAGELIDQPRAPFAARFDARLLSRLDQALGRVPEPLLPVVPPPIYRAQAQFLEPILEQEQVLEAARRLLQRLTNDLARDAVGVRVLRLLLFKMDGQSVTLDLGLAAPSRDAQHIAQLIGLRLYRLQSVFESDFGFEAAAIHVLTAEDMPEQQTDFAIATQNDAPQELARLIDRLQQRLGTGAVRQLTAVQSHIPERAVRKIRGFALKKTTAANDEQRTPIPHTHLEHNGQRRVGASSIKISSIPTLEPSNASSTRPSSVPSTRPSSVPSTRPSGASSTRPSSVSSARREKGHQTLRRQDVGSTPETNAASKWVDGPSGPRPLMLLPRPELADVVALVPEGPPRQFRWRGALHQVADCGGPERIAPEWWRQRGETTRDYYLVEDTAGRRFWLFRQGLYDRETETPQWFVHGVFA